MGTILFFLGFKVANYHLFFLIPGGLMVAIGFYLLKFLNKKEEGKAMYDFNQWRNGLKASGMVLEVDFDQCEIKSNQYREEVVKDHYSPMDNYMALDALVGHDNTQYNNVDQSIIVFEADLGGEKKTFYSPLVHKDRTTLEFLLLDQKSTKIYVDRANADNYYFDVEFLWK